MSELSRYLALAPLFAALAADPAVAQAPSSAVVDEIRLPGKDPAGNMINEISGLAWDENKKLLYAVSDRGHLLTFRLDISGDKILSAEPVAFCDISVSVGKKRFSDAEAIAFHDSPNTVSGSASLLVVFEDGPAAAAFDTDCRVQGKLSLPPDLTDPDAFQSKNKRTESIGYSDATGLLSAPQVPLKGDAENRHRLYSGSGSVWQYKTIGEKPSDIKDLQVQPDGSVMLLEGTDPGGISSWLGLTTTEMRLRKIDLSTCADRSDCAVTDYVPAVSAAMQDRFEGMTRVGTDLFLLATDEPSGSRLALIRVSP